MTTILVVFITAVVLSILLTPVAGRIGSKLGAIDLPNERKVHISAVPRCGGMAMIAAFLLTLFISTFFLTRVSDQLVMNRELASLLIGGFITFGAGIWDDFRRLDHKVKFFLQIVGASAAFAGGIRIQAVPFWGAALHSLVLSYLLTVFWFVLFINAVNLIDGLDGLAAGIAFFTSAVLVILSVLRGAHFIAMLFAALAGASLGFLRYNFNPASIFMGDGGSYFLGYTIAGLSILGSVKSQVSAAMLIPMIALGVPLFDTILSPVRRFILGKAMFHPDMEHIHHRLVSMGFSTRKAVLFLYGVSLSLCGLAIILSNLRNETAGLFLIVLGAGAVLFVRKLGYFEYITSDKIYGWFQDVSDEAGLTRDRRSFLNLQIEIDKSGNLEALWENICACLDVLKMDMAELYLHDHKALAAAVKLTCGDGLLEITGKETNASGAEEADGSIHCRWTRNGFDSDKHICDECLLKLELPLIDNGRPNFGTLWLIKDLKRDSISHYSLRRVEHLRRSVIEALQKLDNMGNS